MSGCLIGSSRPYLNLQSNQSDHGGAKGQRRRQVRAEVEEWQPVRHTGGADHTHHLTTDQTNHPTKKLKKMLKKKRKTTLLFNIFAVPYQVDADVDKRAQVRQERDDRLSLQGQADPLDQATGRLPLHLSPGEQTSTHHHPPKPHTSTLS